MPFAVADEPEHQRQVPYGWDPSLGHLALFGAVGAGTTTAALAVIRSIAERDAADDVHVYVVDAGGGLGPLREVPHVGDVVPAGDRPRVVRLLRFLADELDRRRAMEPDDRAGEPDLVVVVDGLGILVGELAAPELAAANDQLRRLLADGLGAGIRFVVTADRPQTLGARLGAAIGQRALLRHADPGDFAAIGMRANAVPDLVPGRFVDAADHHVCQVADPGPVASLHVGIPHASRRPPAPIGVLPVVVRASELEPPIADDRTLVVPVGIEDDALGPARLRWREGEHVLVTGPPASGRSNLLVVLAEAARAALPDAIVVAVGVERTPLERCDVLDAIGPVDDLVDVLRAAPQDERPWVVLVDDAGLVDDHRSLLSGLLDARRPGLRVAAAARPDELRTPGHWTRPMRRSRSGVLLQPDLAMDGDLFGVRLPRHLVEGFVPGRGFLVDGASTVLTQTALSAVVARDVAAG